MRLRAGLLLCLFVVFLGVGCRKALAPASNDQAPETWITSAPQDTITLKDKDGHPIQPFPKPGTIPVRYHIYWAGSDVDGTVVGYYWAVVETLTTAPPGLPLPSLPGPKVRDYHFTTRTDTTLIFNVTENAPDRQHAFFIYAVDDKGRADPTPARFIFNALDRYPPAIGIDDARGECQLWTQSGPSAPPVLVHYFKMITDTLNRKEATLKDTVPSNAVLSFHWRGEPTLAGTFVTGYEYKLDESQFVPVDSSVHSVSYNTGTGTDYVAPGDKQFTLRALDYAGGASQTTRRFRFNISPTTWYSGPDRDAYPYTHPPGSNLYYLDLPDWSHVPDLPGSGMNRDSVTVLPALRPERRTFFELYKNRIYVRAENDTVDMNSWVVLFNGGFDPDSPYSVPVSLNDPSLPDTSGIPPGSAVVLHPGPYNGSPIGFKGFVAVYLTQYGVDYGPLSTPTLSRLYPNFDPSSSQRRPLINGYYGMAQAGKGYGVVKAIDGYVNQAVGGQDNAIYDGTAAKQLADLVDAGGGTDYEKDLRRRVLTFYIDKAPYLVTTDPNFKPVAAGTTVYPTRTLDTIYLVGGDDDPYDPDPTAKPTRIGGPSASLVLRWTLSFTGKDSTGRTVTWAPDFLDGLRSGGSGRLILNNIVIDPSIVGPDVTLNIQLCDCRECELNVGEGRCVNFAIPFKFLGPAALRGASIAHPGPGSSRVANGRDAP
jgi:hypothetical protein